jgi:hypothetical protein
MPKLRTRPRMRLPVRKRPTDRLILPQMQIIQMETALHPIQHEGQAVQLAPRTRLLFLASIGAGGLIVLLVTLIAFAAFAR